MRCGCCELDDAELLVEHEGIPTSSHSRCARDGDSVVGASTHRPARVGGFVMECDRSKDLDVPWTSFLLAKTVVVHRVLCVLLCCHGI